MISLAKGLNLRGECDDTTEDDDWAHGSYMRDHHEHRRLVDGDDVRGKWQYAAITYNGEDISVLNLYAATGLYRVPAWCGADRPPWCTHGG